MSRSIDKEHDRDSLCGQAEHREPTSRESNRHVLQGPKAVMTDTHYSDMPQIKSTRGLQGDYGNPRTARAILQIVMPSGRRSAALLRNRSIRGRKCGRSGHCWSS